MFTPLMTSKMVQSNQREERLMESHQEEAKLVEKETKMMLFQRESTIRNQSRLKDQLLKSLKTS